MAYMCVWPAARLCKIQCISIINASPVYTLLIVVSHMRCYKYSFESSRQNILIFLHHNSRFSSDSVRFIFVLAYLSVIFCLFIYPLSSDGNICICPLNENVDYTCTCMYIRKSIKTWNGMRKYDIKISSSIINKYSLI